MPEARTSTPQHWLEESLVYNAEKELEALAIQSQDTTNIQFEDLHLYDYDLITQWAQHTFHSMTDRSNLHGVYQTIIPDLASSHASVRHSLFTLAAMDLYFTDPHPGQILYLELAHWHQARALELYIPQLQTLGSDNAHVLFVFSALLLPIQWSFLRAAEPKLSSLTFISRVLDLFDYLLGATVIATQGATWIRQSPVRPLLSNTILVSIITLLVEEPKKSLGELIAHVHQIFPENDAQSQVTGSETQDAELKMTYIRSIELLSNSFATVGYDRPSFDATMGFPFFAGRKYIQLLKCNDPLALVILAHYGAALQTFDDVWWLSGTGARLVYAIAEAVDPSFLPLMSWPLTKTQSNDEGQSKNS